MSGGEVQHQLNGQHQSGGGGGGGSHNNNNTMNNSSNTQSIADYLAQLLKDKKQLAAFPNVFLHLERLLDDGRIRRTPSLYSISHELMLLLFMAKLTAMAALPLRLAVAGRKRMRGVMSLLKEERNLSRRGSSSYSCLAFPSPFSFVRTCKAQPQPPPSLSGVSAWPKSWQPILLPSTGDGGSAPTS